jgi:hypothetical protein
MFPDAFTMANYERLLIARYINGGHTRETALHFAQGEIRAIQMGIFFVRHLSFLCRRYPAGMGYLVTGAIWPRMFPKRERDRQRPEPSPRRG